MLSSVQLAQDTTSIRRPMKLLVIDDDPIDRQTYLRFLSADERNTYIVVEAATAEEGVRLLSDGPYDCVVLDYRLPGADGLAVVQSMHEGDGGSLTTPVVMMTGQGSEFIAVEAMKLGVADYLKKDGLTSVAFQRAIGHASEKAHLRTALREKSQRLEHANTELKRQASELQRFYHAVSHELKTPLTAVREFIALVIDGVAGSLNSPKQKQFLEHAIDGCDQMARQVNDLLDSARLDTGKLQLRTEAVHLEQSIQFAVASVRQAALAKDIRLDIAIDAHLPRVLADEARLAQILGNLLGNAVKFTDMGGEIRVTAQVRIGALDQVEIAVSDTGCGISPEHQERIFDRLFQVPHSGDELMGGGLGLGLSIARQLVHRHGGRLTVESTIGEGSTFRFSLPAIPANQDSATEAVA